VLKHRTWDSGEKPTLRRGDLPASSFLIATSPGEKLTMPVLAFMGFSMKLVADCEVEVLGLSNGGGENSAPGAAVAAEAPGFQRDATREEPGGSSLRSVLAVEGARRGFVMNMARPFPSISESSPILANLWLVRGGGTREERDKMVAEGGLEEVRAEGVVVAAAAAAAVEVVVASRTFLCDIREEGGGEEGVEGEVRGFRVVEAPPLSPLPPSSPPFTSTTVFTASEGVSWEGEGGEGLGTCIKREVPMRVTKSTEVSDLW
jgi:hypothetical protein